MQPLGVLYVELCLVDAADRNDCRGSTSSPITILVVGAMLNILEPAGTSPSGQAFTNTLTDLTRLFAEFWM